jgi:DNA-binding response OmpR family regulator
MTPSAPRTKTDQETAVIPMMMLTARTGPASHRLAAKAGADACPAKPFSPAELLDTMCSVLRAEPAT